MARLYRSSAVVAFFVVLSIAVICYVLNPWAAIAFFSNNIRWQRDHENQMVIARRAVAYYESVRRFPHSISQLVEAGFLPKKAKCFASPYRYEKSAELDFTLSSYRLMDPGVSTSVVHFITRIDDPPEMKMENGSFEVDAFIEKEIAKIEKTQK